MSRPASTTPTGSARTSGTTAYRAAFRSNSCPESSFSTSGTPSTPAAPSAANSPRSIRATTQCCTRSCVSWADNWRRRRARTSSPICAGGAARCTCATGASPRATASAPTGRWSRRWRDRTARSSPTARTRRSACPTGWSCPPSWHPSWPRATPRPPPTCRTASSAPRTSRTTAGSTRAPTGATARRSSSRRPGRTPASPRTVPTRWPGWSGRRPRWSGWPGWVSRPASATGSNWAGTASWSWTTSPGAPSTPSSPSATRCWPPGPTRRRSRRTPAGRCGSTGRSSGPSRRCTGAGWSSTTCTCSTSWSRRRPARPAGRRATRWTGPTSLWPWSTSRRRRRWRTARGRSSRTPGTWRRRTARASPSTATRWPVCGSRCSCR